MAPQSGPYKDENDETKYEPVANNSRSSTESEGVDVDSLEHESKTALLRSLRTCRLLLTVLILVIIFIIPYTTYMFIELSNQPPSKRHGLGTDTSHFVPLDVGEPLHWKVSGENDPWFVSLDSFQSLSETQAAAARLKSMHGSYDVVVGENHTSYVDESGILRSLPPIVTKSGTEMYIIRGFHQMHCVIVLIEAYGYAINQHPPKWPRQHVAHCINMVRESVSCLADAAPVSYVHKKGIGLVGAGQQMRCRDYDALLRWAKEPVRRVEFQNIALEDDEDTFVEVIGKV